MSVVEVGNICLSASTHQLGRTLPGLLSLSQRLQKATPTARQSGVRFGAGAGTGLNADNIIITYNDGSGDKTIDLRQARPPFPTLNAGSLHVRVVLMAPDTLALGEIDLPLKKDWQWFVLALVYDRSPQQIGPCIPNAKSFALRRAFPVGDSLYIAWGGNFILNPLIC